MKLPLVLCRAQPKRKVLVNMVIKDVDQIRRPRELWTEDGETGREENRIIIAGIN